MTLFCHPYFYKKFVTVIFTNVTVFITKTDFDHLSPFLYTVEEDRKGRGKETLPQSLNIIAQH